MAKVYEGKVIIPGDKLGEFFKVMQEAEEKREPFRRSLLSLNREFHQFLLGKYSERTARKHASIVELFIDFICRRTDVERIEEITRGMVTTHFKKWWKRKVWEKSIVNEKILKALK